MGLVTAIACSLLAALVTVVFVMLIASTFSKRVENVLFDSFEAVEKKTDSVMNKLK